jgi:hypothetical protein
LPQYFLHVRNPGSVIQHLEGEELPDLSAAIEAAVGSARDVLIERLRQHQRADGLGSQIEVADKHGTVLAVVELTDVVCGNR